MWKKDVCFHTQYTITKDTGCLFTWFKTTDLYFIETSWHYFIFSSYCKETIRGNGFWKFSTGIERELLVRFLTVTLLYVSVSLSWDTCHMAIRGIIWCSVTPSYKAIRYSRSWSFHKNCQLSNIKCHFWPETDFFHPSNPWGNNTSSRMHAVKETQGVCDHEDVWHRHQM